MFLKNSTFLSSGLSLSRNRTFLSVFFFFFCTSVSNWAPNMSTGKPLLRDGLCLSSQSLKEKGVITFMVFSWKGGSLKTSSAHKKTVIQQLKLWLPQQPAFLSVSSHLDQVFLFWTGLMPWIWQGKILSAKMIALKKQACLGKLMWRIKVKLSYSLMIGTSWVPRFSQ